MASEKEMENDPNFAIICSFLHSYGHFLQFPNISIKALKIYLKASHNKVHRILEDIFIRLLRRWKGRCPVDSWERILISFCYTYSDMDAWELEKFGFPRCSIHTKMRMLKNLLEVQFDCYNKFKEKINEEIAENLRLKPIGRDKNGLAYWLFLDKDLNVRVYTEEQDDTEESQSWQMVVKDKKGVLSLINTLQDLKDLPLTEPTSSVCSAAATPVPQELSQVCEDAKKCYGDSDKENTHVTGNSEKLQEIELKKCNVIKTEELLELCPQSKSSDNVENIKCENANIAVNNDKDCKDFHHENVEENSLLSVKVETVKSEPIEDKDLVKTESSANSENQALSLNSCDMLLAKSSELINNDKCCPENKLLEKTNVSAKHEQELKGDSISELKQVANVKKAVKNDEESPKIESKVTCKEKQQTEVVHKERESPDNSSVEHAESCTKSGKLLSQRKRKRGKVESDSEQESIENSSLKITGKSESELSETPVQSSNESKDECSPTKRRRDKFLKKRKPVKANVSESTDESEEPEKKAKTSPKNAKNGSCDTGDSTVTNKKSSDTGDSTKTNKKSNDTGDSTVTNKKSCDTGDSTVTNKKSCETGDSTMTNKKKRMDGEEEVLDEEKIAPTSKKGRQSSKTLTDIKHETGMSLRRSSRVTRSVARLEYTASAHTSRKKPEKLEEKHVEKPKMERKDRRDQKSKKSKTVADTRAGKSSRKKRGRPQQDDSDEEEDDEDIFHEDEDSEPLHWSSPSATEYELDSDGEEYQPIGKNAKRQEARKKKTEQEEEDTLCNKCAKSDNPDLMLLCDECDAGYHTGCLRPPLMLIPLGDWYCPPCEHVKLIESLQAKLKEIESVSRGNDRLQRRKERLKFVGISLDNILQDKKKAVIRSDSGSDSSEDHAEAYDNGEWETLKDKEHREKTNRQRDLRQKYYYDWGNKYIEEALSSSEESESESSSEEYSMVANRSRRQRKEINYNFSEFDQIILKAIDDGEDTSAGAGGKSMKNIVALNNRKKYSDEESSEEEVEEVGKGRGKDMANIEAALAQEEREEAAMAQQEREEAAQEEREEANIQNKDVVDVYSNKPSPPMQRVKSSRKRGKRLTALSDEEYDEDTDEYKASDDEVQTDENYSEEISDESYEYSRHSSKKSVRRSSRRRRVLRDMSDFVVDDGDSEDDHQEVRRSQRCTRAGKSKRVNRSFSEEEEEVDSEYYSDDSIVAKKPKRSSKHTKNLSKKKRKIGFSEESEELSESEVNTPQRKKSSHYEDDSDFNPSEEDVPKLRRRATSKRINYQELVGSESEVDTPKKKKKSKIDLKKFIKDEDSNTDEYSPDQCSNNESEEVDQRTKKSRIRCVSESSDSDRQSDNKEQDTSPVSAQPTFLFKPKINRKTQGENTVLEVKNAQQGNNAKEERSTSKKEVEDSEDDLEGIGDIIDYITNE